jgi:hypothetical protein
MQAPLGVWRRKEDLQEEGGKKGGYLRWMCAGDGRLTIHRNPQRSQQRAPGAWSLGARKEEGRAGQRKLGTLTLPSWLHAVAHANTHIGIGTHLGHKRWGEGTRATSATKAANASSAASTAGGVAAAG